MSTNNAPGFVSGLKAFFTNPLYSDLTLICGDERFEVHRMLLHEQSPVFRKMLNGGFVESAQGVITVHDDPVAFRALLKYLYTGQYDDSKRSAGMAPPEFAVSMYAIADKYDFEPLRKQAARKLDETCDPKQNSNDFVAAIHAIEANTPPNDISLWNVVIPKIKANITTLCQSSDFLKMVTTDIPDLAIVLFQNLDPSTPAVFRSTTFVLPPTVLPTVPDVKAGGTMDDSDEDDYDDEDNVVLGPAGRAVSRRSAGPYRGHGRRLG